MQRVLGILISFGLSVVVWAGETISEGWLAKAQWETPFYVRVSGKDGPTVVITGGFTVMNRLERGPRGKSDTGPSPVDGWWSFPRANIPGLQDGTRFYRANRRHAVISTGNSLRPRWQPRRMACWARRFGSLLSTKIPIG